MQTSSGRSPATTRTPPAITELRLQKADDGEFTLTVTHRSGRKTRGVYRQSFRLDHDGRLPALVELWLWGQVQTPILVMAEWEQESIF
jgi:hypothetical protein